MIEIGLILAGMVAGATCVLLLGVRDDCSELTELVANRDRASDAAGSLQSKLDAIADYVRDQKSGTAKKVLRMIEERSQ